MRDRHLFKQLYDDHAEMVYNLCLNYLQNAEDAEEVTQDVFVKVHRQMKKFEGRSSLKTWIYRITVNHCLDQLKSRKRKKRFGFHVDLDPGAGPTPSALQNFNHPGVKMEDQEAVAGIMAQIQTLPAKQRMALILKAIEGLSQKEIAEAMEMSTKAVESLLSRARSTLKKKLSEAEG